MAYSWHDLMGNIGVIFVLSAYLLTQLGRISAKQLSYSIINGIGAAMILISLSVDFNMSAFLVEAAWLAISLIGIVLYFIRNSIRNNISDKELKHGS